MDPFIGKPFDNSNVETWGHTNYYKLNEYITPNPLQTRIGGKKHKKNLKKSKKYKKKSKKYKKKSKKGGGLVDERFTFPGVNTTRNIINSGQNMYNTISGKQLNVSPNPLIQPIYSGST
jgi:hypothetical protein